MNSTSTQFFTSTNNMAMYEPIHQVSMWGDFKGNAFLNAPASMVLEFEPKLSSQSEENSHGMLGASNKYDQEASKPGSKVLRRLAQNREAARKSRLRKKAYVQQLESSKLKLMELEQELQRTRQQQEASVSGGVDVGQLSYAGNSNSGGITVFDIEYGHWVEEQNSQVDELRNALQSHIGEIELRILVDSTMTHYFDLFRMKATAAKADVFYLMSGMWETAAERFFLWLGGFRPSELIKIIVAHLGVLTEQQRHDVCNLKQSCQQAEDALSQGMEKLQQILAEAISTGQLGEGSYLPQIGAAVEKFDALVRFMSQADHLRQETLLQMSRILTTRQSARALLALGEYFQRLRALSSLWDTRANDRVNEPT